MREHGRGERWLLLCRWKTVRGSKRAELQALFAANPRLFKAYVLCEQLDRLWTYQRDPGVFNLLMDGSRRCAGSDCPKWNGSVTSCCNMAAYCDHRVRFGVVESLITTIKAVLRQSRGMCDQEMLLLKLKWATVHAIRSARDLVCFWPFNRFTQIGDDREMSWPKGGIILPAPPV
jgi:hypothetical protein